MRTEKCQLLVVFATAHSREACWSHRRAALWVPGRWRGLAQAENAALRFPLFSSRMSHKRGGSATPVGSNRYPPPHLVVGTRMVSNRWVRSRGLTYRPTACRGALGVRPFGVRIPVDGVWSSKNVPDRQERKGRRRLVDDSS